MTLKNPETPYTLGEWLEKWESKLSSLKPRKGTKSAALRASKALDELEFLLMRTIGKDLSE
jgi:hypothetical protein